MITICFTYFKSLTLANLRAALYSVRRQDLSRVDSLVVVDNNTDDSPDDIQTAINELSFPVPVRLLSFKHGDSSKTHSWSTNAAVREALTPWVLFIRADYLLDFSLLKRFTDIIDSRPFDWDGFIMSDGYHLSTNVESCEQTEWRSLGTS